jgi:hypothetical protein
VAEGVVNLPVSFVWLVWVTAGLLGAGLGDSSRLFAVEGWIASIMIASPGGAFSL